MAFRQIHLAAFNRTLSNIMAHPSSADPETHEPGLDQYVRLGGNCIHLHGEGGETHTRRTTGEWLRRRRVRQEFFLCTQICHSGWDQPAGCGIDRFTAVAVSEDIDADLELLGTAYLDFVYLDDNPQAPFEPVVEAIGRQIESGRVRAFGVRNWLAKRLSAAHAYLYSTFLPKIAAVVTTELALATPSVPLWPEYIPFDSDFRQTVEALHLPVFAHAADVNVGQCLYGDHDPSASLRRNWLERWDQPGNTALVQRVQRFATTHELTTREVNIAWLLNQSFPCIVIVPLTQLLIGRRSEYEHASQVLLQEVDRAWLRDDSAPGVQQRLKGG